MPPYITWLNIGIYTFAFAAFCFFLFRASHDIWRFISLSAFGLFICCFASFSILTISQSPKHTVTGQITSLFTGNFLPHYRPFLEFRVDDGHQTSGWLRAYYWNALPPVSEGDTVMVTHLTWTGRVIEIKELGESHTGERFTDNSMVMYWLYGFAGVAVLIWGGYGIASNFMVMLGIREISSTSNSGFARDRRFSQLTRSMGVAVGRVLYRWPSKM
jgi:hypothetical protein